MGALPRVIAAAAAAVMVLLATGLIGRQVYTTDRAQRLLSMNEKSHQLAATVQSTSHSYVQSIARVGDIFVARPNRTHPMSMEAFSAIVGRFVRFGGSQPRVTSVGVVMPVLPSERAQWEAEFGRSIRDQRGVPLSAPLALNGAYMPFVLMWPPPVFARFGGVDPHAVNPVRALAFDQTIATGEVVASSLVTSSDGSTGAGFHARIDHIGGNGLPGAVSIFVQAELFGALFEKIGTDMFGKMQDVTEEQTQDIFVQPGAPTSTEQQVMLADVTFSIASRKWRVAVCTTQAILDSKASYPAVQLWLTGSVLALLAAAAAYGLVAFRETSRAAKVQLLSSRVAKNTHQQLVTFVNHELRNPLTVIMGTVDLLLGAAGGKGEAAGASPCRDPNELQEGLAAVGEAAQQIDLMLRNVNAVRGDGLVGGKMRSTDIAALLRDTTNQLAPYCSQDTAMLVRIAPGTPSKVTLDASRLRQVLLATLHNALQATPRGIVELRVRAVFADGRELRNEVITGTHRGEMYLVAEVLNVGQGLGSRSGKDLMGDTFSLPEAEVPKPVLRAARATWPAVSAATCSEVRERSDTGRSERSWTTADGLQLLVNPITCDDEHGSHGFSGAMLSLPLCHQVVASMHGAAGIEDMALPDGRVVTRFWCAVKALPSLAAPGSGSSSCHSSLPPKIPLGAVSQVSTGPRSSVAVSFSATISALTSLSPRGRQTAQPLQHSTSSVGVAVSMEGGGVAGTGSASPPLAPRVHVPEPSTASTEAGKADETKVDETKADEAKPQVSTVVVVDDEPLIRRVAAKYLRKLGVGNVVELEDGDELEACLRGLSPAPDLVLLDIVMKRSRGTEVLQRLRGVPEFGHLPVYAMTSNVEQVALYEELGFNGLLAKPFTRKQLRLTLAHSAAKNGATFLA